MSAPEEWRPVPDFPHYEISNTGRIVSHQIHRGKPGPRELSPSSQESRGGTYRFVRLSDLHGRRAKRYVHRLVAAAFIGPGVPGLEVRHLDGNASNNVLANLAYGTHSENELDKVRHGTHPTARRTHCPKGHPYDSTNTYRASTAAGGFRQRCCRRCKADYARRYHARKAAA